MAVLVVYNPVCGDSTAEHFFNTHVIPRLNQVPTEIICTRAPADAGIRVLDFLRGHMEDDLTIVLGSGDGTLHEIVNQLSDLSLTVHFVLVPCGTANALYASLFGPSPLQDTVTYKLRSLEAFLRASTPTPLTLAFTLLLGSDQDPRPIASIVVASTALHAAILRDSEQLRKQLPGIERFKVAARQNITKWYASRVTLLPIPSEGVVHTYDPHKDDFVPIGGSNERLDVQGPFAYFLSTVNADRLEPMFRINPTISKHPPVSTSMDVVMIRPHRDPSFIPDAPQARVRFAEKTAAVLAKAYEDGNHINLRYSENGNVTEGGGGDMVVECFRCGGWEWIPDETDKDAHLLCADGTVFEIQQGGRAVCTAQEIPKNFHVHI